MTREALNKLTDIQRKSVELYRKRYSSYSMSRSIHSKDIVSASMRAYVQGLKDAGVITEQECKAIYIYMTIAMKNEEDEECQSVNTALLEHI